ncbi:MAG: hypothetical protein P8J17_13880 [Halioglobus sp.]|nr:hypothetical protein [Halioglobus sp.]
MSSGTANSTIDTLSGQDAFRMRMEEQCRQILHYRQVMRRESGRNVSSDEAALEWIERFAATFDQS